MRTVFRGISLTTSIIALVACGPAPRPVRVAPAPVRVVAAAPASSPPPPVEASSAPPPPPEPPRPGCTLAEAQHVVGHNALLPVGVNFTSAGSHTVAAWATGSEAAGLEAHGVEIAEDGSASSDIAPIAVSGRTVEIKRISAAAGADGVLHLVSDRRFREGAAEYIECGTARSQVARLNEQGQYEDEGSSVHFDLADCRSITAGENPFIVGVFPGRDEDLFSGTVELRAQWWRAAPDRFATLWSYPQSQDIFDRGIPWLRALAQDAPAEPVAVHFDGGYAIAWRHRGVVYLQWLGADLSPRGAPRVISTRSMQPGLPQLAINGREVVAVFAERAGTHARSSVHAVRLPLNGSPMPRVVLAQGTEDAFAPSVVAVGNEGWAVSWSQGASPARRGQAAAPGRVWIQMFDASLRAVADAQMLAEHASDSRVVALSSRRVVVAAMSGDGAERDVITRAAICAGRDATP